MGQALLELGGGLRRELQARAQAAAERHELLTAQPLGEALVADQDHAEDRLLANYAYQRDRLARIADGTATDADRMAYPDDSYVERDHGYVTRFLGARRFHLVRDVDETGVSGTGIVAEGALTAMGNVAMVWLTAMDQLV